MTDPPTDLAARTADQVGPRRVGRASVGRRTVLFGLLLAGPALLSACAEGDGSVAQSGGVSGVTPAPTIAPTLTDSTAVLAYGDGPTRYGHLDLPVGDPPPEGWPVAVLIHGGFWRTGIQLDLMFGLAQSLNEDGWATWNIQYSSVGDPEGGWPGTFDDVATAIDHVAAIPDRAIDRSQVVAIGHSAGGHLALWAATRAGLAADAPGGGAPVVPVTGVVAQAAVTDLLTCVNEDLGRGACNDLMGARPSDDLDRYLMASPIERLPLGVPTVLVHGDADDIVPIDQSGRFAFRAVASGDNPMLLRVPGADHFAPIMADHEAWQQVRPLLTDLRN